MMFERARAIRRIKSAEPYADAEVKAALAPFSPSVLVEIARSREAWLVRRAAVRALDGRVDDGVAGALLEISLDAREVTELRCAALDVLARAGRTESVPALRRLRAEIDAMQSPPYGLGDAVVSACARLGDIEAAVAALRLRYDAWTHRRHTGEAAVQALQERVGTLGLARAFGAADASAEELGGLSRRHPEAVVRRWAIDVAPADAPWLTETLGDEEWVVAEGAEAAILRGGPAVGESLRALAREAGAAPEVRARAILALLRRGQEEEARSLWSAFEDGRIELIGVPDAIRRAVLHHYLPGQRGTDPRWVLEGELDLGIDLHTERYAGPDEAPEQILAAARQALEQAGFTSGKATPIGFIRQQGDGTYCHLETSAGVLEISELGRFVATEEDLPARARESLKQAGFLFVEGALAADFFDGLNVYFFGRREPLSIYNLLFYWQD
ncbi:MAG: hypothetical protein R3B70_05015 [Polyangiaceae bacterium]